MTGTAVSTGSRRAAEAGQAVHTGIVYSGLHTLIVYPAPPPPRWVDHHRTVVIVVQRGGEGQIMLFA